MHAFVFGFVSLKRYRTGFIEAIKLECMCVCVCECARLYIHIYIWEWYINVIRSARIDRI